MGWVLREAGLDPKSNASWRFSGEVGGPRNAFSYDGPRFFGSTREEATIKVRIYICEVVAAHAVWLDAKNNREQVVAFAAEEICIEDDGMKLERSF